MSLDAAAWRADGTKRWCALLLFAAAVIGVPVPIYALAPHTDQPLGNGAEVVGRSDTPCARHAVGGKASAVQRPPPDWRPPTAPKVVIPPVVDAEQAARLAEQWGVELLSLRLSAAGYMMDFRFRVLDADKALPLFDHRIKPYVVVDRSQAKLPVPMAAKVGAFRTTNRGKNITADRNYYMMFANPDRHVKAGEQVTLIIGDFKAERLTVN
jgi:hypothetical protein